MQQGCTKDDAVFLDYRPQLDSCILMVFVVGVVQ